MRPWTVAVILIALVAVMLVAGFSIRQPHTPSSTVPTPFVCHDEGPGEAVCNA
jgi:hypothetical protein